MATTRKEVRVTPAEPGSYQHHTLFWAPGKFRKIQGNTEKYREIQGKVVLVSLPARQLTQPLKTLSTGLVKYREIQGKVVLVPN